MTRLVRKIDAILVVGESIKGYIDIGGCLL